MAGGIASEAAIKRGGGRMRRLGGAEGHKPQNGQAGARGPLTFSRTLYIEPSMNSSKPFNPGSVRPIHSALACHTWLEAGKVTPSRSKLHVINSQRSPCNRPFMFK